MRSICSDWLKFFLKIGIMCLNPKNDTGHEDHLHEHQNAVEKDNDGVGGYVIQFFSGIILRQNILLGR